MGTTDLKPGKTPGRWTVEELKRQMTPYAWGAFQAWFSAPLGKQPDYSFSAFDLDAFFQFTGH